MDSQNDPEVDVVVLANFDHIALGTYAGGDLEVRDELVHLNCTPVYSDLQEHCLSIYAVAFIACRIRR